MEKASDKRIVYLIGIVGIIGLFFTMTKFTTPFLLKISGETELNGFLFFINRMFMWLALAMLWLYSKNIEKQSILLWPKRRIKILFSILAVFAICIFLFLGNMLISGLISQFANNVTSPKLLEMLNLFKGNLPLLIFTVFTAAVVEEYIFRGYIQPRLEVIFKKPIWGILGSAILFALLHLSYATWIQFLGPLFIGLVFSVFYWKFRNIRILIICHFVWDFVGLLSMMNLH